MSALTGIREERRVDSLDEFLIEDMVVTSNNSYFIGTFENPRGFSEVYVRKDGQEVFDSLRIVVPDRNYGSIVKDSISQIPDHAEKIYSKFGPSGRVSFSRLLADSKKDPNLLFFEYHFKNYALLASAGRYSDE